MIGMRTQRLRASSKGFSVTADAVHMVNSISSTPSTNQVEQQAARTPQPPTQASANSAVPQDKVTLKSTGDLSAGDPDHDGK